MRELRVPKVSPVAIIQSRWALIGPPWLSRCTASTPMVLRCPMDNPCALPQLSIWPDFSAGIPIVVDSSSCLVPATTAGTPINLVYSSKTSPPHSVRCRKLAPHFLAFGCRDADLTARLGCAVSERKCGGMHGAFTPKTPTSPLIAGALLPSGKRSMTHYCWPHPLVRCAASV